MTFAPSSTNGRAWTKPTNVDEVSDVLDGVPGVERARDGALELLRGHTGHAGVGDEVADGKLPPAQALGPAADASAELQIRAHRNRQRECHDRDRECLRPPLHGLPLRVEAITSRTRAPNASNASGRRSTDPRLTA